jgi:hypothetical protein
MVRGRLARRSSASGGRDATSTEANDWVGDA